jgi:hypothetical protein
MSDALKDSLLREYQEVSNNFRLLTDIRFRLLGLMPAATLIAAVGATVKQDALGGISLVVSLFGLAVVLGLAVYSARNDQLYDELVGRAAEIERQLGIRDGSFSFRPRAWFRFPFGGVYGRAAWTFSHGNALSLIYGATIAAWLTGVLASSLVVSCGIHGGRATCSLIGGDDPLGKAVLAAAAMAGAATLIGGAWLRHAQDSRKARLRSLGQEAMSIGKENGVTALTAAEDVTFLSACLKLAGVTPHAGSVDAMRRRARFLADPGHAARYLPQREAPEHLAYLIASLCDLPPRWILDWSSGRRASLQEPAWRLFGRTRRGE